MAGRIAAAGIAVEPPGRLDGAKADTSL